MTTPAVHRIIEQHAALQGSAVAISDGDRAVTYRDLNYAANALARRLQASGFRRGTHAIVTMPAGIDLAVTLLAILKMGGCYTWNEPAPFAEVPPGVSFLAGTGAHSGCRDEARYLHLDLASALAEPVACSPNLPIVTRATDTACVLPNGDGSPAALLPHATIAALRTRAIPHPTSWAAEPGALDLWMALMAGRTAVVESRAAAVAA